jgi:4-carboxymuconolactone decarboxylase
VSEADRFTRGAARLAELDPGLQPLIEQALESVSPDFARMIVEVGYGDVYDRPGLELKQRQMVVITALTTLGNAPRQLRGHIGAALNVGLTPEEIVETIIQTALYAGFPAALNALTLAREVFAERGVSPRKGDR